MNKKLSERKIAELEAGRDIWKEVLEGVHEIKSGGGKRHTFIPKTQAARARLKSGLSQLQFAAILGVSKRTLEQWEQGRRQPSGAAKTLIKIADKRPDVFKDINAR